jgi:anti-anti-sigma factor
MKIDCEQLEGDVYRISLLGRMDLPGTEEIETDFVRMTSAPRKAILLDLSGVNFLTSFAIRTILYNAKGLHRRGGKMVLLNPDVGVKKVLETAGIHTLIPIRPDLRTALAALAEVTHSDDDEDF